MKSLRMGMSVFAAALMASSLAHSQMTEEEFQALLESQGSSASSQEESGQNGAQEELVIESLAIPDLYLDIDNHQARIRRLEQMLAIAELEQQYLSLTGTVPDGAVTLNGAGGGAASVPASQATEIESAFRDEIANLKRQIDALANAMSNQETASREMLRAEMETRPKPMMSDFWKVNGISIFGDTKTAVITARQGNSFSVRQGDTVGDVRVISIDPSAVRIRERGETVDLPLAGESYYTDEGVVHFDGFNPYEHDLDRGAMDFTDSREFISYETVPDSTSR